MKKVKRIWEENKVLLVLAVILVVCLAVFIIVAMTYFYGSSNNVYGNRLDVTRTIPISNKLLSEIKSEVEKSENVNSASVTLKGLIVYININFKDEVPMADCKVEAEKALALFNEDELATYDVEFTISTKGKDGFTLMGARNASGSGIVVWNNYNVETEEESAE